MHPRLPVRSLLDFMPLVCLLSIRPQSTGSLFISQQAMEQNNSGSHLFQSEIITLVKSNKLWSTQ